MNTKNIETLSPALIYPAGILLAVASASAVGATFMGLYGAILGAGVGVIAGIFTWLSESLT